MTTTRKYDQNDLVMGQWNAICDVCGFKFKSGDLKLRWDGLMVCQEDYEQRHPMDYFKGTPDNQSTPWSRPEGADSGGSDINSNTFPPTFDATAKAVGDEPDSDGDGYVDNGTPFYSDTGTVSKFTA